MRTYLGIVLLALLISSNETVAQYNTDRYNCQRIINVSDSSFLADHNLVFVAIEMIDQRGKAKISLVVRTWRDRFIVTLNEVTQPFADWTDKLKLLVPLADHYYITYDVNEKGRLDYYQKTSHFELNRDADGQPRGLSLVSSWFPNEETPMNVECLPLSNEGCMFYSTKSCLRVDKFAGGFFKNCHDKGWCTIAGQKFDGFRCLCDPLRSTVSLGDCELTSVEDKAYVDLQVYRYSSCLFYHEVLTNSAADHWTLINYKSNIKQVKSDNEREETPSICLIGAKNTRYIHIADRRWDYKMNDCKKGENPVNSDDRTIKSLLNSPAAVLVDTSTTTTLKPLSAIIKTTATTTTAGKDSSQPMQSEVISGNVILSAECWLDNDMWLMSLVTMSIADFVMITLSITLCMMTSAGRERRLWHMAENKGQHRRR